MRAKIMIFNNICMDLYFYYKIMKRANNKLSNNDSDLLHINIESIEELKKQIVFLNNQIDKNILPSSFLVESLIKKNKELLKNIIKEQERIKKQFKNVKKELKPNLELVLERLDLYYNQLTEILARLKQISKLVSTSNKTTLNLIDIYDMNNDHKIEENEIEELKDNIQFLEENKDILKKFI
jgi:hypothetical protein